MLALGLEQVMGGSAACLKELCCKLAYLSCLLDARITSLFLATFTRAIKKAIQFSPGNWIEYLEFNDYVRVQRSTAAFFKKHLTFFIPFFKDCHGVKLQKQNMYF